MSTIAEQLTIILTGLRAVIAEGTLCHRARAPMLVLLWGRVGRTVQRLEALFARWRAGTLPKPRPSRAGQPRTRREQPRFPQGRTWLVALLGYHAAGRASQLQHLLAHPDMAEFLAAAPQATRILRPLCHMLGLPATALPSRVTALPPRVTALPPRETALPPRPATARPSRTPAARPALAPQPSSRRPTPRQAPPRQFSLA